MVFPQNYILSAFCLKSHVQWGRALKKLQDKSAIHLLMAPNWKIPHLTPFISTRDIFFLNLLKYFLGAKLASFFPENYEDVVCAYLFL